MNKDQSSDTILAYDVILSGDVEVPVIIEDTFDTSILEVYTDPYHIINIYGGNQYYQGSGATAVSYSETSSGILLTANSVPTDTDGNNYPYYRITYYLKLKEGVDLDKLAQQSGGKYEVSNTAKWGDHESTYTFEHVYNYLEKKLLNDSELGGTGRTAKYQIVFNAAKASIIDMESGEVPETLTMTDTISANQSLDYSSIRIVTDPDGMSVPYSVSGTTDGQTVVTYTVPNETKVTVTYETMITGNGSQKFTNTVSILDQKETVERTKNFGSEGEGEGAVASFKIVKVDGYDANKKLQGVKFKISCENPDVDFGGGKKELILETAENGEITLDGEAYTFYFDECYHVQEVEAPEEYGSISFPYFVTLTNDMAKVDYQNYIYYYSDSMQIKNWPLEGLVVEKQVESDDEDDLDRYYKFRISILDEDGNVDTTYNSTNGDDTFVGGVAEFELKNKEQKMFWGFEKGTRYKVEEIFEDEEGNEFTTTVSYDVYDDEGKVIEHKTDTSTSHEGALTQDDEVLVFTNTRTETGSLKIKKNVTVNGEATTGTEADGDYIFEVKDAEGTVVATETITITNGASKEVQVDELVPGTYTVSEDTSKLPEGKGMVLVGDNDIEIEVAAGETAEVPTAEFTNNKPGTPEFEKKIQDTNDSTGVTSSWQDSADYDIGDAVPFKLTATLPKDVSTNKDYSIKFEDRMESTLTFVSVSKVTLNGADITKECTIKPTSGGQTFTVSKSWTGDAVTDALNGATVEVYFTATLNKNAKIGSEGNVNAARLHYDNKAEIADDSGKTPWDYVIAFTYKLDLSKVDQDGKALTGAEFKLEKKLADGSLQKIDLSNTGNVFKGTGLDDGTYVLTETKAPEGYKPIDPIKFTVSAEHTATWNYISTGDAPAFNGEGRTDILTSLTGSTTSGDLVFDKEQSLDGFKGTVTNKEIGALKIEKTVTGTKAADKEFKFEIALTAPEGTTLDSKYPAKLDGEKTDDAAVKDGKVTVTLKAGQTYEITDLPAGTTYAVTEMKPLPDGYSEGTHTGTSGTIKAGITGDVKMNNIYTTKGEVVIQAKKNLNGRPLKADQFSFELKDAEGKVLQTKKNAADGSVTFDALKYTQDDIYEKDAETGVYSGASTKTYNYTINEVIPEGATPSKSGGNTFEYKGYTFDATVYTVAVVLKDNGDGTITATASPDAESLAFTNAYGAAGTLKLDAEKTFKNGRLKGDEFTFELKDADGKVLQSKKNDAAGNVSFDLITYKMEDLAKSPFKYTVSEVIGDKKDVKYDNTVYTVTVTLKDNDDGTLSVEKKIDNGGKLKFVNEQLNVNTSIKLGGVKVLKGQTLKANQFKFVLTDENGKKISTAGNDADGNFTFKEINYKLSDLNGEAERVYTYKVSEVKGSKSNIVYDTKVYTVKVTVTDNGDGTMTATADLDKKSIKFVNKTVTKKKTTSKKSGTKKSSGTKRKGAGTGDNSPLGLLFGGLVIGAAGIAALLWVRKKRNKKS